MQIKDVLDRGTQVVTHRGNGGILAIKIDSYDHLGGATKVDVFHVILDDGSPALVVKPMKIF